MSLIVLLAALSTEARASTVVVNEFYRSGTMSSTGDEWVELVLLQDLTSVELEGYFVGDSTSTTASKFSGYRFTLMSDFAAVFPAGTVLTVTGGLGVPADLTYDPALGDWNLTLPTNDLHITSNGSSGDLAGTDVVYVDTNGTNGDATLSASGFAVNWDATPGVFGALGVLIGVPANVTGALNAASIDLAADPASWLTSVALASLTPGQPNGGDNTVSIEALRAGPACADADGDGVCDVDDVCPGGDDLMDADGDGVPDACDACPGADDYADLDADGYADDCDNCPEDPNADQADADADGIGDVCEPPPTLLDATPGIAGSNNSWTVIDGPPNETVIFVYGGQAGLTAVPGCPGLNFDIQAAKNFKQAMSDGAGTAVVTKTVPIGAAGKAMKLQGVFTTSCILTNVDTTQF